MSVRGLGFFRPPRDSSAAQLRGSPFSDRYEGDSAASSDDPNQWTFKHSSRNRPLNDSMNDTNSWQEPDRGDMLSRRLRGVLPVIALLNLRLLVWTATNWRDVYRRSAVWTPCIVAVTVYGQHADRQRSRAAGFAYTLVKPSDFDALNEIVRIRRLLIAV